MNTVNYKLMFFLVALMALVSCEFDNYDEPKISFSGQLRDGNEVLNTKRGIVFKLYQYREDGFVSAGTSSINVYMDQEGNFSSLLFPGRYKMVVNTNNGETESPDIYSAYTWKDFSPVNKETGVLDTIYFTLDKNKKMDFQVTPYYKYDNVKAFYENDSITINFAIHKVVDASESEFDLNMRTISVFVSPTMHLNSSTTLFVNYPKKQTIDLSKTLNTGDRTEILTLKVPLAKYYSNDSYVNNYRSYIYLRLGVSTNAFGGVYNYSPILKVEGIPDDVIKKFK